MRRKVLKLVWWFWSAKEACQAKIFRWSVLERSDFYAVIDIENYESNTTITGSSGNDTIFNKGNEVLIDFCAGNDSILKWGTDIIYAGDGKDVIFGFDNDDSYISSKIGNTADAITVKDYKVNLFKINPRRSIGYRGFF